MTDEPAMKWVGVSGSTLPISREVDTDVRREVTAIVEAGDGVVTGGALGVDWIAANAALRADPSGRSVVVILPTSKEEWLAYHEKSVSLGYLAPKYYEIQRDLLDALDACGSLEEHPENNLDNGATSWRNAEVVACSDELMAFQVNRSGGTQQTMNFAKQAGIPVQVFRYRVRSLGL